MIGSVAPESFSANFITSDRFTAISRNAAGCRSLSTTPELGTGVHECCAGFGNWKRRAERPTNGCFDSNLRDGDEGLHLAFFYGRPLT
jgi:hypothetical protein